MSTDPGAATIPDPDTPAAFVGSGDPPAAAAVSVAPGDIRVYEHHDPYAAVAGVRHLLVLVVADGEPGTVYGIPLGYADEAAAFPAAELAELVTPDEL